MTPYYQDDAVTLYHGDCREILPTLADGSAGLVLTDPPYDEATHSRGDGAVRRRDGGPDIAPIPFAPLRAEDVPALALQWARLCARWALTFCAVRQIEAWSLALEAAGLNVPRVQIWVKPDASPQFSGDRPGHGYEAIVTSHPVGRTRWNGGGHKGVYIVPRMDRESGFQHPTQKPLLLITRLVNLFSDPGDLVLDPFAGSGTTLRAAKDTGRRAIGIELEERYCEIAARRMAQEVLPLGGAL